LHRTAGAGYPAKEANFFDRYTSANNCEHPLSCYRPNALLASAYADVVNNVAWHAASTLKRRHGGGARHADQVRSRPSASLQCARGYTLPRAGRQRFRSALHAACAIDRCRRREAASSRPLGKLLRESSRQTVDFGRPIAWAIALIDSGGAAHAQWGSHPARPCQRTLGSFRQTGPLRFPLRDRLSM
jgi:hypothetical protein